MPAQKGRLLLIGIGDGATAEAFTNIAGLRSKTLTLNNESVDITTSDEAPWRALLGDTGLRSMSVSGSGVFQDDAAINAIEDLVMSGLLNNFEITFENSDVFAGAFQVTSFEYGGEHTAEQTYSMSLESSGTMVLTRA